MALGISSSSGRTGLATGLHLPLAPSGSTPSHGMRISARPQRPTGVSPLRPWLSGPTLHRLRTSLLWAWVQAPLSHRPPRPLPGRPQASPLLAVQRGEVVLALWTSRGPEPSHPEWVRELLAFRRQPRLCAHRSLFPHGSRNFVRSSFLWECMFNSSLSAICFLKDGCIGVLGLSVWVPPPRRHVVTLPAPSAGWLGPGPREPGGTRLLCFSSPSPQARMGDSEDQDRKGSKQSRVSISLP